MSGKTKAKAAKESGAETQIQMGKTDVQAKPEKIQVQADETGGPVTTDKQKTEESKADSGAGQEDAPKPKGTVQTGDKGAEFSLSPVGANAKDTSKATENSDEGEIHGLRTDIDEVRQVVDDLEDLVGGQTRKLKYDSQPLTQCVADLRMAKQWLGKVCQHRGYANPYKEIYEKKEDIVPTIDVAKNPSKNWVVGKDYTDSKKKSIQFSDLKHLDKVSFLRSRIGTFLEGVGNLTPERASSRQEAIAWTQVYVHLENAKMALGNEFARVRES